MSTLKDFQKLVIANAMHVKGLKAGDKAPNFILPNAYGNFISLLDTLKTGPVVLKFYRGEWCPICNLDLREIQRYTNQFKKFNTKIIAVSAQKPDDALHIIQKNNIEFEVLSDSDQKVIKAFNLQFNPGNEYHKRRDLSLLNGNGLKTLPVPATFVIDKDFTIIASHVEANYTERMPADKILMLLKKHTNY